MNNSNTNDTQGSKRDHQPIHVKPVALSAMSHHSNNVKGHDAGKKGATES